MTLKRAVLVVVSPALLALFLIGLVWYLFTKRNGVVEFSFDAFEWFLKK